MTDYPQLTYDQAMHLAHHGKPGELELAVARGQLDDVRAAAQVRRADQLARMATTTGGAT